MVKKSSGIKVVTYPEKSGPGRPRKVPRVKFQVVLKGGLTNGVEKCRFVGFKESEIRFFADIESRRLSEKGNKCTVVVSRVKRKASATAKRSRTQK